MKLKVMLDPGAKMPTRAHATDAGLDLYSREYAEIAIGDNHAFDTGVHIEIPEGYVGMVKSKSGLNIKQGLQCEGVIDAGYTGSIMVKLHNGGTDDRYPRCYGTRVIQEGQKIAQLVILPIVTPELEEVDALAETERGDKGFGSSGAF